MLKLQRAFTALLLLALVSALLPYTPTAAQAQQTPAPKTVTVAGTIQSKLGCSGDWKPECANTFLTYDNKYDLWTGSWKLPAGDYEYKAALNGTWDENYGQKAIPGGSNISLSVKKEGIVKFYYDHKTHWLTENQSTPIATVVGNFQTKLGCASDNQPDCLFTWLQNPKADGIYTLTTSKIPQGKYEAKVAINESLDENYGANGAAKGANIPFEVPFDGAALTFKFEASSKTLTIGEAQQGDLSTSQAIWVNKDIIAWKVESSPDNKYQLHYDPNGKLGLETTQVKGGSAITLTPDAAGLNEEILKKSPQLKGFAALKVSAADQAKIPEIVQGQVVVSAQRANGRLLNASGVQTAGVLDSLFSYNGALGAVYDGDTPTLKLWAPTAKSVKLFIYADSTTRDRDVIDMTLDRATGVWSAKGTPDWTGKFYLYSLEVYTPATGKVENNIVTDPYSLSLATNSKRSQIVNLKDPALKPAGWDTLKKPELASFSDVTIYELHLRDFSISDQTVPEAHRGTYLAFTDTNSNGMKHLKALAEAGLTHLHLLPVFDIASVSEDPTERKEPDMSSAAKLAADSDQQQESMKSFLDKDGFNWGYDPFHYTVPEGSYATNPDGTTRIKEFREMVKALNESGLRVTMDVVYNHTNSSGQDPKSVLDKIVPGYYQRLNTDGRVENSTCCANTASENAMMEKLMVDSLVTWAVYYKVDAFRFDLMGHHMLSNMVKVRDTLRGLTLDKDGVDGSKIYIYGEGWDFGEVAKNARGVNATQINLAGTGIGTFNDRLRDGVRGGSPFSGVQDQGFLDGLYYDPNGTFKGTKDEEKAKLLSYADWIRVGLAGNLKDYKLVDATGKTVTGGEIDYNGAPTGYTANPKENIVYVDAHDNETLFDAIAFKAPLNTSMQDRVRMQNLGIDLASLSQGIPFFHAGIDMLRSKSLDRDSYNSGDWFNRLDFTYQSNNFGVGLPNQSKNGANWPIMKTILGTASIKPAQADILQSVKHMQEMLKIRKSSKLFRLETADDIKSRVQFLNTGPNQTPGLIIMSITDLAGAKVDQQYKRMVVAFNATGQSVSFNDPTLAGANLKLHPVQASSADTVVRNATASGGNLTIPARTTAVFVETWADAGNSSGAGNTTANNNPGALPATGAGVTQPDNSGQVILLIGLGALVIITGAWLWWMRRRASRQ